MFLEIRIYRLQIPISKMNMNKNQNKDSTLLIIILIHDMRYRYHILWKHQTFWFVFIRKKCRECYTDERNSMKNSLSQY